MTDHSPRVVPGVAPLVLPLAGLGRRDLDRGGGKAANLGELLRLGLPVPPGFVITTAAYDLLLDAGGLRARIAALVAAAPEDGTAIREAVEGAPVPPSVSGVLLAAYRGLGGGPVAVRSSATAEDLPQAAFAGQQETYLNVVGEEALLAAVRGCWASLWTDRAMGYRRRQGTGALAPRMAVVVQRLIQAEVAGVLFTANPLTGARDEVVIDASAGLGEAVVSGLVTPDHLVVDRRSGRVREWRPGRREVLVRAVASGGTEQVAGAGGAQGLGHPLPPAALRRLLRLSSAIEAHFGAPQDIEWAWSGGQAHILQARPITALPPEPPAPARSPMGRFAWRHLTEMLPLRPYPLDMTTWSPALFGGAMVLLRFVGVSVPGFGHMAEEEDGVVVRLHPPEPHPTPRLLLAPLRILWTAARYNPLHWQDDPLVAELQGTARALEARDLPALPWSGLIDTLGEALALPLLMGELRVRYFPRALLANLALRLVLAAIRSGRLARTLLAGVQTQTLAANQALEALAEGIRAQPALATLFARPAPAAILAELRRDPDARAFVAAFDAFLDRYGHRELVTLLATQPTWKDAPETVIAMLQALSAGPTPVTHSRAPEPQAPAQLRWPVVGPIIRRLAAVARLFVQLREDTHFYGTMPLPVVHRVMRAFGRRLLAVGVVDAPEDVFHLRLEELRSLGADWPPSPAVIGGLRDLVLRRLAKRAALADVPWVPLQPSTLGAADQGVLLRGTPGSPGVAEGPVRIVRGGAEFGRLQSGDVLVAPFTSPAWTPLFQRAAAVVVDTGGVGSHSAIVAREYGIPAVMGTGLATTRLTDGQRVRVDGSCGVVLPAGEPPHPSQDPK